MRINKSDRNDAVGIARIMQVQGGARQSSRQSRDELDPMPELENDVAEW
jgi:hypothetical protein